MRLKIHYRQALAEIAEIVADDPHHVYQPRANSNAPGCRYVHLEEDPPCPGCIIGVWLHIHHDLSFDDLNKLDGKGGLEDLLAGGSEDSDLLDDEPHDNLLPFDLTKKAANFLTTLQFRQDHGDPWSTALFRAINET